MNKYLIIFIIVLFLLYNEKDLKISWNDCLLMMIFISCVIAGIFTGFATFHWLYFSAKDIFIRPSTFKTDDIHPASL